MNRKVMQLLCVIAAVLLLTACRSGGGETTAPSEPLPQQATMPTITLPEGDGVEEWDDPIETEPVRTTEPQENTTEPSEDATEPQENPAEPSEDATEPTESSTEPWEDPKESQDDPAAPQETPTEPQDDPAAPQETPTEPQDDPTEPQDDPTEPQETPTEPQDDPTEPQVDPTQPPKETDPTEPPQQSTEPPATTQPQVGGRDPADLTYEEYLAMSPSEQQAHYEQFPSLEAYIAWHNAALAEYEENQESIEVTGGLDIGDFMNP